MSKNFIPVHGGYAKLKSYQKSEIIYDATVYFTKRFYPKFDRTIDQMVRLHARANRTSPKPAWHPAPHLRVRGLCEWSKDHLYTLRLRELNRLPEGNYETFRRGIENEDPEICANVIIGLIKVATYLLFHQIRQLEHDFLQNGGLRERMTKARLASRQNQKGR